jgi:hypothetical protein
MKSIEQAAAIENSILALMASLQEPSHTQLRVFGASSISTIN